jgi:uncharacterized protein (DUF58 family)
MTLVLGFSAVNTGNNLLYLLVSALLGFMAVSGLLGQQNLNRLALEIVPPEEVYAGHPTLIRVRLLNRRRRLPGFLLRLELPQGTALFPVIEAGGELSRPLALTPQRRGYQSVSPVWVSSHFPINFFVRSRRLSEQPAFLVLPAPRNGPPASADGEEWSGAGLDLPRPGSTGELQSISDYQGTEPLKAIHWKLSARHAELKVKQLSGQGRQPVMLDPDRLPGTDLEERLGRSCYLINRLMRNQQPVGLRLGGREIAPALGKPHRLRLLRELALYDRH